MNYTNTRRGVMQKKQVILKSIPDLHNNGGFTLIELLVVVLIIGILAAVALPQYQRVVEKSKAIQALGILKSIAQAEESFYLANGYYTSKVNELDINLSWDGKEEWATNWNGTISNAEWAFQTNVSGKNGIFVSAQALAVGRLTGNWAGGGFVYILSHENSPSFKPGLYCAERDNYGKIIVRGAYCPKLFSTKASPDLYLLSSALYRM